MEDRGGAVTDRIPESIKIVDLATKRNELALNCRFRSICYAHSKNCYTCPRRRGVQYILRSSDGRFGDTWEIFELSAAYQPTDPTQIV